MKDINILIVGVGGQGVILASDTVAEIGMNNGYDVKKSDSIGMAQRGGSVVSHVRWGEHVYSPMNKRGEVDFLLGFEKLEAARSAYYLKPDGVAIISDVKIPPVSLISNNMEYPEDEEITSIVNQYTHNVYLIPATDICAEAGNTRALNMVMAGALSVFLGLDESVWEEDIRGRLRPDFVDSSLRAFSMGAEEARKMR
ncbi:MAG: indolepyruvate oxidoreductase subunit beta [Dehalococcoidales bacterium]|nr:indolepyruvate oxidoreductase subunit beta [Dehalococcoidales bacterium]